MIIASREVTIDHLTNPIRVPIHVEQPVLEGQRWRCTFEIGWPDRLDRRWISGIDSMAALVLALKIIGTELYMSSYHKTGRLYLDDEGGYGFPLPSYVKDVAVGMDAKY